MLTTETDHLYFDLVTCAADAFSTLCKLSVVCVVILKGLAKETSLQDEATVKRLRKEKGLVVWNRSTNVGWTALVGPYKHSEAGEAKWTSSMIESQRKNTELTNYTSCISV